MANLSTDQVWVEIEKNLFAVLGMVTARNEARTAGVVYIVHERKLYIATLKNAWKTRHIAQNRHVSLTVTIPKRIPLMPWIKIPAATITFAGEATVRSPDELDKQVLAPLYRGLEGDSAHMENSAIIEVEPVDDFVTYGVGVSLMQMRDTELARGRVSTR